MCCPVFAQAKDLGAEFVVTTEKDSVRISTDYKTLLPFFYTKLEIEILSGSEDFEGAVDRICFNSRQTS